MPGTRSRKPSFDVSTDVGSAPGAKAAVKQNDRLDAEYDKRVASRPNAVEIHDQARRDAIKAAGIKVAEANRAVTRKPGARFDE